METYMRYKILSALAAVTLAGAACSNITDVNQNPNGPVNVQPPSILPSVQQGILSNYPFAAGFNATYTGTWVQQFSEIQYPDEDRYIVRSGTTGGWGLYTGAAEDAQRIINEGIAASTPNWEAAGRIMKAYAFDIMTDAMGDLPYTDALKGDSMLQPTYDTQQTIYDSLFAQLTTAAGEIDPSAGAVGFSSGDLIYGGDMAEWRKLANSLRLRLALHIVNVDPARARSEAEAAVAAGVFTSNDDNAGLSYLSSAPNQNPIYVNHLTRDDYGMSATLVDSMLSLNDPRLPIYAAPYDTLGHYQGKPNGMLGTDTLAPPNSKVSRIGDYWRTTPNATMYFMTYAEVLLLEAEGANRGWNMGASDATLYQNAVTASMNQWGISTATTNTYLAQAKVAYAGGTAGLTQIQYQLWIQLYMNGIEAWTEWRRTHVPSLLPGPDVGPAGHAGVLNSVPERMPYDDQELVLNEANVSAAVARQKFPASNDLFTPLWFTGRAP
jgi:Starch-binding associating with outer membrane